MFYAKDLVKMVVGIVPYVGSLSESRSIEVEGVLIQNVKSSLRCPPLPYSKKNSNLQRFSRPTGSLSCRICSPLKI